jgi:hypothetical protein
VSVVRVISTNKFHHTDVFPIQGGGGNTVRSTADREKRKTCRGFRKCHDFVSQIQSAGHHRSIAVYIEQNICFEGGIAIPQRRTARKIDQMAGVLRYGVGVVALPTQTGPELSIGEIILVVPNPLHCHLTPFITVFPRHLAFYRYFYHPLEQRTLFADFFAMSSGAIAQLMGFITVPDMKRGSGNSSLLKFRLAFNRFDFGTRKSVTDFLTVAAFGKMADRIYSDIENNLNYIYCFCDVRVNKYNSKTGIPVEHTEFIVNDCRMFAKPKSEVREHRAEAREHREERCEHKAEMREYKAETRDHKPEVGDGEDISGGYNRRNSNSFSANISSLSSNVNASSSANANSTKSEKSEIQSQQGQMFQNWCDLPY